MSSSTVLYDVPGPKARRLNVLLSGLVVVVVAAILGFIIWRFIETGQFSARQWALFGYSSVWMRIGQATLATLEAFGLAAVLSLALGMILAVGRLAHQKWISVPVGLLTELLRAVPVLILMMIMYYGLPSLGVRFVTPFLAVVVALTLYNGSVLAEVFRAGVQSLPRGQNEAGLSIGLGRGQVMRHILMPQAIRAMLPLIIAQLVVVLKDTALGFIVTYDELLKLAKSFGSDTLNGAPIIPSTIVVGVIYISLCLMLSGIAKWVESRTRRKTTARI